MWLYNVSDLLVRYDHMKVGAFGKDRGWHSWRRMEDLSEPRNIEAVGKPLLWEKIAGYQYR
jgi:hypothetical protein